MKNFRNFLKDENGAAAVEYTLLVALIALVIVAAVTALGTKISTILGTVTTGI